MEPNQEKKTSKSPLIIVLIVLILALAAVIAYLYIKPLKTGPKATDDASKETTQTTNQNDTPPQTLLGTTGPSGTTTQGAAGVKADIDKDVQSLDSLNLSGPENDYGEDNLNDLTN